MFCYSRYDYKKYLCKYLSSPIFNLIDILFRFDDERRDTFEILVKDKPLYVVSIRNFYRICFKLFFYYYLENYSREIDIYFSIKFFLPTREARERSFASLLAFSSLFNFFKYLENSSHSDQHFPLSFLHDF